MSLSTLLEAAKYLDYLDSNNHHRSQQQQQQQPHQQHSSSAIASPSQQHTHHHHQQHQQLQYAHATGIRKTSSRRQRSSSKKDAANTMLAMSLPASTGHNNPLASHYKLQGVPIPLPGSASGSSSSGGGGCSSSGVGSASDHHRHHAASLSSSFTTGSPLSSFASTALLCSKASGATFGSSSSSSSSAASSLSSSDLSSSCGEILMGDNEFCQPTTVMIGGGGTSGTSARRSNKKKNKMASSAAAAATTLSAGFNNIATSQHNYHLTHQPHQHHPETNPQHIQPKSLVQHQFGNHDGDQQQSVACYIAVTSAGPQLVTMSPSPSFTSTSASIDGGARAGHVIHAATSSLSGTSFEPRQFSLASGALKHETPVKGAGASAYGLSAAASASNPTMSGDSHLSNSPNGGSHCGPLIMARVQPMILNSLSPPAHQGLMAFQSAAVATASSPTSSSSSYSRHRELHKTLEKNRRAHLRHCFELLKAELPASECADKKTSHINIIKLAIRYVLALRQQEYELDNEIQRLTKIKTELTEKLSTRGEQGAIQQQQHLEQKIEQQANQPQRLSSSPSTSESQTEQSQQPVAEQHLSFLLSQSKID